MKLPVLIVINLACINALFLFPSIGNIISLNITKVQISSVLNFQSDTDNEIIRDKAHLITTRVFSFNTKENIINNSASGTLIEKKEIHKNNNLFYAYLVLTNKHVSRYSNNSYYIQTHDGLIHQAFQYPNTKSDIDLGILWFSSPYKYEKASIGELSNLKSKDKVFVAGFPCDLSSIDISCPKDFLFTSGNARLIEKPLVDGYQIAYSNDTKPGTSGGPVLNIQGQIIGINGRGKDTPESEQYRYADNSGYTSVKGALAVPIEKYSKIISDNPFNKIDPLIVKASYTALYLPKDKQISASNVSIKNKNNQENYILIFVLFIFFVLIVVTFCYLTELKQENESFAKDNENLKKENESFAKNNECLKKENESFAKNNECLKQENNKLTQDNNKLKQEHQKLTQNHDTLK